ncbi:glycosyl transferase family 2 [Pseudopedobacter saltans DSM 12145]|uniref:Glycosyl transferase family 2 n=1 Tax=Pseudopedobacter saltans (strain ATCC 51119 / DSM 12145 / JCM 21818 / CCUG 39354 / LMG 10337 / NBRC 100064 / NCIMB 13643) TaxID=762903 RepID=F0SD80_PSESL|nr:glycosyltransferase family 2 protein [Pseudopedobacter saltans]ADY52866.1 glycosyl transferase family 2 [Pseudopedobacter saltans DSM 12145]
MSFFPKISIVTPNYNQEKHLEQTILSVINQGYPNLEYIIIDGGSTDNSLDIIHKYSELLTYWVSEKDKGMYDALQKGFNQCTGDIMGWINSDDFLLPNSLFVIAKIFNEHKNIKWLTGSSTSCNENNQFVVSQSPRIWSKFHFYLDDYQWISQESTFWKKELWYKSGAYIETSLHYAGDFELWLRFFRHEKLYSVIAPFGCFRFRKYNQISLNYIKEYHKEARGLISKELVNKSKFDLYFLKIYNRLTKPRTAFFKNVPFLKSIYYKIMDFPLLLRYNRATDSFDYYK